MKLIDVIGSAVACESQDGEGSAPRLAQLLHAVRAELHDRRPRHSEMFEQIVGGLGRARERSRKNLGVRDDESLLAARGAFCVSDERREFRLVERAAFGNDFSFGEVAGVQTVDQQNAIDRIGLLREDLADCAVAGAEAGEIRRTKRRRLRGDAFAQSSVERRISRERSRVSRTSRSEIHRCDDERPAAVLACFHRQPRGAEEVDDEVAWGIRGARGGDVHFDWLWEHVIDRQLFAGERALVHAIVSARVLHHRRRVLGGGFGARRCARQQQKCGAADHGGVCAGHRRRGRRRYTRCHSTFFSILVRGNGVPSSSLAGTFCTAR